jgi:TPR repeat protein
VEWYRKAAEQGHAPAQDRMGQAYADGTGVKPDTEEALRWFRKAAEQGYAPSQFNLGFLYFAGRRVPKDDQQAEQWLRKAAEQEHATAQSYLGVMFSEQSTLPADYVQAHMWLQLSEERGYGLAAMQRETIELRMSTSQINEAKKRAEEWRARKKQAEKPPNDGPATPEAGMAGR